MLFLIKKIEIKILAIQVIFHKTLSKKQLENSPRNEKLIKEATSIKFNIVYK